MIQINGNMFHLAPGYDAICITTNGFVTSRGNAVMGMGCAKTISDTVPEIKGTLGRAITQRGNHVHKLGTLHDGNYVIVSFPVKGTAEPKKLHNVVSHAASKYKLGSTVPGFHLKATTEIITKSTLELVDLTNEMGWSKVLIPRPGCGAGELDWTTEVEPILSHLLDNRFTIITF